MIRRLTIAALGTSLILFAAGCGGTTKAGVSTESGATLVRSGALAYVAVNSDLESPQWQQTDKLLDKFPGRDKLLEQLRQGLSDQSIDYDRDVKGALGPEVDIAAVAGGTESPAVAFLTKPESMEKAKALVRKLDKNADDPAVTREVDGWLVVAQTDQALDRVLKGSTATSLAEDPTFKDATDSLPDDALAKAYVNGRQLGELLDRYLGAGAQTAAAGGAAPFGFDKVDWIAAALDAKDEGVRVQLFAKGAGGGQALGGGNAFTSKLLPGVPADAFAFLNFRGASLTKSLAQLRKNPDFDQAYNEAEKELGMSLDDVVALFTHEVAFYVRRAPGLPEFALALETPDTQAALATLDRLAARVAHLTHGVLGEDNQGGVPVKTLTIKPVTIRWAGFDGRILLTTGPTGISDYRSGGDKLADDAAYKHALDVAGAPDETGGVLYVNIHDAVTLISAYLGIEGDKLPPDVAANLEPLQSLVAFTTTDGDVTKSVLFLEIK